MIAAAVLGGGKGVRMKSALPKQFSVIDSVPVIIRSIQSFINCPRVDMCIVSVPQSYVEYTQKLIDEYIPNARSVYVLSGGATRGETLKGVLCFLNDKNLLTNCTLLTHDAVRPFVTSRIIEENIDAAQKYGACNTCISATDTMFLSSDGTFIGSVPNRSTVYHAQTPQSFNAERLFTLINGMPPADFAELTDGASVFMYYNLPVYMVKGEEYNIKITYPQDILRAEAIAKQYFKN